MSLKAVSDTQPQMQTDRTHEWTSDSLLFGVEGRNLVIEIRKQNEKLDTKYSNKLHIKSVRIKASEQIFLKH